MIGRRRGPLPTGLGGDRAVSRRSGPRVRSVPADPPGDRRHHRDPRLSALQARHALVPAVRARRADPAQGRVDRLRQLPLRPPATRSSGARLLRTVIFTAANVALTIVLGTLIAFLLVRVSTVGARPAHCRPRPRLVDARRRRRPGLVLDDELPERDPQPRSDASSTSATTTSTTGTRRRSRSSRW